MVKKIAREEPTKMPRRSDYEQAVKRRAQLYESVPSLPNESSSDVLYRRMMSFYLMINIEVVDELRAHFPWLTEFYVYTDQDAQMHFREEALLVSNSPNKRRLPAEPFPMTRRHKETFVREIVNHFIQSGMYEFMKSAWDERVVNSHNGSGVMQALVFGSTGDRKMLTDAMFELDTLRAMGVYESTKDIQDLRRLFWYIVHCYAGMCVDFDAGGWKWFGPAFALRKTSLQATRTLVSDSILKCDSLAALRDELVRRYDDVVARLRKSVQSIRNPGEVRVVGKMLRCVRENPIYQVLRKGVPTSMVDQAEFTLDNAELLLQFLELDEVVTAEGVSVSPCTTPTPSHLNLDTLIESVMPRVSLEERIILEDPLGNALRVNSELHAIRFQCAVEFKNMVLEYAHGLVAGVKEMQTLLIVAAVELQTLRALELKRSVRRVVKQIKVVQRTAMVQMIPIAVGVQEAKGVIEMHGRAFALGSNILELLEELDQITPLVNSMVANQRTLLDAHRQRERKRVFLAAAGNFLPSAMFEREVDCGMCIETLDWNQVIFI